MFLPDRSNIGAEIFTRPSGCFLTEKLDILCPKKRSVSFVKKYGDVASVAFLISEIVIFLVVLKLEIRKDYFVRAKRFLALLVLYGMWMKSYPNIARHTEL